MINRPLLTYSFVITFEPEVILTKQIISFEVDEAVKTFTMVFIVPIDYRNEFFEEVTSFTYFYLQEVESNGTIIHQELYRVKKFTKQYRKYDYNHSDVVQQIVIGTYK